MEAHILNELQKVHEPTYEDYELTLNPASQIMNSKPRPYLLLCSFFMTLKPRIERLKSL